MNDNDDDGVAGGSFLNWHPSEGEADTQSSSWVDLLEYATETGPLYDGARITVVDSIGLLLGFCLEHNATNRVLSSLLEIIRLHMPKTSRTMGDRREHHLKSLYYLRKIFEFKQEDAFKKHYICGKCNTVCENLDVAVCECCKADVDKSEYFVTLDVASQLEELFKG
ncbi:uncharacterized protein LOC117105974 [Anneissia japonica]|uniref:uncharacterized protein LOC117105974 n=1 Tax=Anneissia japonica TaxID=1529436 RepID=UPI00142567A5|nr:uncharacterized protein LOC117105974 [Anneissia japonica]